MKLSALIATAIITVASSSLFAGPPDYKQAAPPPPPPNYGVGFYGAIDMDVNLANGVGFNEQNPISRSGKATGRSAFEMQSAQAISPAYYFDLAARDYSLADGAIELVIEGLP